jgi:predicted dehydrogenase
MEEDMTLKIALAGAGYIAEIHARAIQAHPDADLVAVVEKFPEQASNFAKLHQVEQIYETVEEMITTGGVDAIVIGTPNFLHAPQAIVALQARIHVMVEKPMAMNTNEALKMQAVAEESGTQLMVAHCWRFDEEVLWLKAKVGELGQIIRTKGIGVHSNWGPGGWFTQKALAGGGALADMGIHAIDTARFLLGDPKPSSVYAKIGTYFGDFDVDDTGTILINWDNGVNSFIESGWWQPHMDGPEAATQLYGRKGFGQIFPTRMEIPDPVNKKVDVIDEGFPFPREEHCPQEMYNRQMAYFVESALQNQTPNPGAAEGIINMQIVDAAYESARTGQVVEIQ